MITGEILRNTIFIISSRFRWPSEQRLIHNIPSLIYPIIWCILQMTYHFDTSHMIFFTNQVSILPTLQPLIEIEVTNSRMATNVLSQSFLFPQATLYLVLAHSPLYIPSIGHKFHHRIQGIRETIFTLFPRGPIRMQERCLARLKNKRMWKFQAQ